LLYCLGQQIGALGVESREEQAGIADVQIGYVALPDRLTVDRFVGKELFNSRVFFGGT